MWEVGQEWRLGAARGSLLSLRPLLPFQLLVPVASCSSYVSPSLFLQSSATVRFWELSVQNLLVYFSRSAWGLQANRAPHSLPLGLTWFCGLAPSRRPVQMPATDEGCWCEGVIRSGKPPWRRWAVSNVLLAVSILAWRTGEKRQNLGGKQSQARLEHEKVGGWGLRVFSWWL